MKVVFMEMHNKIRRNCCHTLEMKGKKFYMRVIKHRDYSGGCGASLLGSFQCPMR